MSKNILEIVNLSTEYLKNKGIESPRRSAEELIADALHLNRIDLYTQHDRPLNDEEVAFIREHLLRRGQGEPWQYIRGFVEFYHCKLKINPSVLIPRQETEILVDLVVKELEREDLQGKKLLDLCTGSGCIGLALKKRFAILDVTLADISQEALKVAEDNAVQNELEVHCVAGDLFAPFKDMQFDLIVSNPPYISQSAYQTLAKEVKLFEPKAALLAGETGLEFYERFAHEAPAFLKPKGKVWLEIGYDQGQALLKLFSNGPWRNLSLRQDWAGHDRFFSLEIE